MLGTGIRSPSIRGELAPKRSYLLGLISQEFKYPPTAANSDAGTGKTANKFHIHSLVGTLALINRV